MARTALVTGANRGIGYAIAEGLAGEGFSLVLAGRDAAALEAAAETFRQQSGISAQTLAVNLNDATSIDEALQDLARRGAEIDVLVNNAGLLPDGDMLTMPWTDIEASTQVNALAPLQLMRGLMPGMARRGYGRVVNVSSGWGSLNGLGPGAYGITKAFLNAITIKGSREAGRGILVNAMCPGWVRTRMGGAGADRSPEEGADTAIFLSTLPNGGPTGQIFRDRQPIPWDEQP